MPAVEIADSIVQSGRETLEKVICKHVMVPGRMIDLYTEGDTRNRFDREMGGQGCLR